MKRAANIILGMMLTGLASPAFSHAIMTSSIPEKEEVIASGPEQVRVCFNEIVGENFQTLAVITAKGRRMDNKDMRIGEIDDKSCFVASVKPLLKGKYYVRYRAESADGHVVTGKYTFYVGDSK
jgi:methionine-rich copper-binding protein CopC